MNISVTRVPAIGPILPGMQPYTAARPLDGKFVLLKTLEIELPNQGLVFTIGSSRLHRRCREFVFDGVSIPRVIRGTSGIRLGGRCRLAGTIHDYLYSLCGKVLANHLSDDTIVHLELTRKECDELFYDHLVRAGIARWRAWYAYKGVRIGGFVSWNAHEKRLAKGGSK